jgi:nitric-oxide synthase
MPPELFRSLLAADRKAAERLNEAGKTQALEKLQALSAELADASRFEDSQGMTSRQFPAGAAIYQAGEAATSAFFVLSGEVNLFPPGCPVPHETVGAGIIFGDREAASDSPRQFQAIAANGVELLEIPASVLHAADSSHHGAGTNLKSLSFVHNIPRLGAAYRFLGEVDGRSCVVTDYAQPDGRRVRVRYFSQDRMVEAGTTEAVGETVAISTPLEGVSFLLTRDDNRLAGLTAKQDWAALPDAMSYLLRGASLESWQIDALRSTGQWLSEAAAERVSAGSEVVCACTSATVTCLRLAAKDVDTVDELIHKTGAGGVCGGCRSRLPLMLGREESILCRMETEPLCSGAVTARLLPAAGGELPTAIPGQHIQVEALLDNRWVGRPYTLTAFGPERYELGVKIEASGLFSNWICQAPQGSLVRVSYPQGDICPQHQDTRSLVYIVAGIGITTAVAAARAVSASRRVIVHYVFRDTTTAPYLEELRAASASGKIVLHETQTSATGRPSADHWAEVARSHAPCEVIVCGPQQFNEEVVAACKNLKGVSAIAESFQHPHRGEGAIPKPGSWRVPGFKPSWPAGEPVPVKSKLSVEEEATRFLAQYLHETKHGADTGDRVAEVREEIRQSGTWTPTATELGFAAQIAWRNAERCVGRLYWRGLHLRDCRHITSPKEIAEALFDHLRFAFNGGDLRPAISVFAPDTPQKPSTRIWNPQLLRYAGMRLRTGKQIGDPAQNELTQRIMKLGWQPAGTDFDLLPLVIEGPGEEPQFFELPQDCRQEIRLTHPQHAWFADLGLRWYCVPAVSDMVLDVGGIVHRFAPFNGWYLDSEIAARNFTDTNRYNLLPLIAEAMGLDISNDRSLWRDKAMVLINEAVLHSFDRDGVKISDHHAIGHEFLEFCRNEQKADREPYGKWMWLVPPSASSASVLYQEPFRDVGVKPAFRYQKPVWSGRPL